MTMFKRRTPEAVLLTAPYSGTNFTLKLLATAGSFQNHTRETYIPQAHWLDTNCIDDWNKIVQTKAIITARDPFLSAIRSIKVNQEDPVKFIADSWAAAFKGMEELDFVILDIGCREAERLENALNVLRFAGIDVEKYMDSIIPYVDAWMPENESHSEHKTNYLKSGKLPDGYDWNLLYDAAIWYNKLLTNER